MGWCAIDFCNDIWILVRDEIKEENQRKIAEKIIDRFYEEDMDDCCGDTEIEKVLKTKIKKVDNTKIEKNDNESKIKEAIKISNNVLYFDDSSDYQTALWEILTLLTEKNYDDINLEYID
jgi:hypothetical protein